MDGGTHNYEIKGPMPSVLVAGALIFTVVSTAKAQEILSAGTIYGGPDQAAAVCYFYNSGTTPLGLSETQLSDQFGTILTPTFNDCGATLPAGQACNIASAIIANNTTYSCKTVVSPRKANARGILEVRDIDQRTLQNIELR